MNGENARSNPLRGACLSCRLLEFRYGLVVQPG